MSTKTVLRVFVAALAMTMIGGTFSPTAATASQTGCKCCTDDCHCCKLEAEQVDVEKSCFEVEEKVICIPRVVFPWQTGKSCFPFCKKKDCGSCDACDGRGCKSCNACVNNGAKTRTIRILKSSKKAGCPVCEYTWSPEEKACNTGCNRGCCDAGCAAAPCDAAPVYFDTHEAGQFVPAPVQ